MTPYDAAGNQLCSTDQYNQISLYSYDMEGRISQINALNNVNPAAWYTYGADGTRVRKDKADGTLTEYVNFGGQTIAERDEVHQWTDYIYAGGKKIAKIPGEERWMGLLSNPPSQPTTLSSTIAANLNYTVKANDQMCYRQFTADNDASGLSLSFSNGVTSDATWITSDEQPLGAQTSIEDGWTHRCIDLTHGNTTTNSLLSDVNLVAASTGNGFYTFLVDMSIISQDGSVTPIFGTPGTPVILSGDPNPPSLWTGIATPWMFGSGNEGEATHFYVSDHLGTAQLELASGGWTIYSGQFAPFGGELVNGIPLPPGQPDGSSSNYKFTGKERDAESGNDYFGARYYGNTMGRFMSPDWSEDPDPIPYAALSDPQSLNLYSYVRNNPLSMADEDGHDGATPTASCGGGFGGFLCNVGHFFSAIGNGIASVASSIGNAISSSFTIPTQQQRANQLRTYYSGTVYNGIDVGRLSNDDLIQFNKDHRQEFARSNWRVGAAAVPGSAIGGSGGNQPLTNSQVRDLANYQGPDPVKDPPFDSHGQLVFKKGGRYFSPDVDSHSGGVWKEFNRQGQRVGTLNENLERIGK